MADENKEYMPRLRFPEFMDNAIWKSIQLGELCSIRTGKKDVNEGSDSGAYPFFTCAEKTRYSDSYSFDDEALLIAGNAYVGLTKYYKGKFEAYQRTYVLTKFKNINVQYLYVFLRARLQESLKKLVQTSAMQYIKLPMLKEYPIFFPMAAEEQQKIADCLSSIDELIQAHEQKRDALVEHKKGLMQRLFPAEGETTPRWRFPEFRKEKKWDTNPLGTLATKIGSGVTPRGGEQNYLSSGVPFVRSQNVGWGKLLLNDIVFIPYEIHETFLSTELHLEDVLLNITGASIGRCALVDNKISGGNVNQHVCIIRVKKEKLNSVFLMQYIISAMGQKQIDSYQAGGNRQGLNFAQVAAFAIPLPSLPEQQKIADCLSSLDARIEAEEAKIAALREHKQGLMQRLFPQSL